MATSIDSWWRPLLALAALLSIAACDTPSDADEPDDLAAVALEGTNVLVFEDGGRLDAVREAITRVVPDAVSRIRGLMPVTGVTIRISAGTSYVIPEIGIGGRTHGPFDIQIVLDPGSAVLTQSIETELFPLLGHEMHHAMRFRTVGYGDNLLEAMVSEGLADQFAVEVAGIDPPLWSKALSGADLVLWSARAREQWFDPGYDYEAWFFGTREIPRWAGYTIGFDLTGRFLRADPARRASGLIGEPAESFIPPDS